jgi:hypothetical protein
VQTNVKPSAKCYPSKRLECLCQSQNQFPNGRRPEQAAVRAEAFRDWYKKSGTIVRRRRRIAVPVDHMQFEADDSSGHNANWSFVIQTGVVTF